MKFVSRKTLVVVGVVATVLLSASPVWAVGYTGSPSADATQALSDITGFVGTMVSAFAPVIIGIAGAVVGITILGWGIRTVFHKVKGASHF